MKPLFDSNNYLPTINGLIGDKLAENRDPWAIPMSFRTEGRDVSIAELGLRLKGSRVAVLVHGLMADERIWKKFVGLDQDLNVLHLRYNSGLHISENGQIFAALLESLHDRLQIKKVYLVGHSMGGLVVRSACHYGRKKRHHWLKCTRDIFLIAVPNAGAPLEKLGHVTARVLNRIKWHLGTIGNLLEKRSNGIKDLRHGSMLDEDWNSPGAHSGNRHPVPPIPGIRYHVLVGTLSKDEKSLMAKYFGDGLITQQSAVGATLLHLSNVKVLVKTGHNSILSHPEAIRCVRKALQRDG